MSDQGPGLAQAEPQLPEQALALPDFQVHTEPQLQECRQGLAIPQASSLQADLCRCASQCTCHNLKLFRAQPAWTPWAVTIGEPIKAAFFKPPDPVLNRTGGIAKQLANLGAGQPLGNQQNRVQAVIVARILTAADFILNGQNHVFSIRNSQRFHIR